jgi:hypothetical protein
MLQVALGISGLALTAVTILAYQEPVAYARLFPLLLGLIFAAVIGLVAWHFSAIHTHAMLRKFIKDEHWEAARRIRQEQEDRENLPEGHQARGDGSSSEGPGLARCPSLGRARCQVLTGCLSGGQRLRRPNFLVISTGIGGEGGIRTLGTVTRTTVFEF